MRDACKEFREAWEHGEGAPLHHETCAPCKRWVDSLERLRGALTSLARVDAPPQLAVAVAREFGGDRSERLQRVLESLVRRGAPAALDERVSAWIGRGGTGADPERRAQRLEALRALDVQQAPGVLERLLREELQDPQRRQVERFSGTLARMRAPQELAERIAASVKRRALVRLVAGPLTALAAAGLIVWLTLRSGVAEPHTYRFRVLHATTLEELDPTARALAESLGGGVRR